MAALEPEISFLDFMSIPLIKEVNFDEKEFDILKKCIKVVQYKKKEKILKAGEEEISCRFVQQGLLRQYYIFNGKEINIQFGSKNDIVCSYFSYMSHGTSEYFIEAAEPSTVFVFERKDMDSMMTQGFNFIELEKKITAYMCRQKSIREKALLNYDALGRLQYFMNTQSDLFLRLPQIYIASYLNIQPETFSALKKKLK
jgi:CRP-like cAMP-binding protein